MAGLAVGQSLVDTSKVFIEPGARNMIDFLASQIGSVSNAITAAGTTQTNGFQLTTAVNTVGTAAAGTGVILPVAVPGMNITVNNEGANTIMVYGSATDSATINGIAGATGVSLLPGTSADFNCSAAATWICFPASSVFGTYNTNAATSGTTVSAANVVGGQDLVVLNMTGTLGAGGALTLPTATSWLLAMHCPIIGSSNILRIINSSGGAFAWTVTTNTGLTLNGTLTIAQNTWREFLVKVTAVGTPAISVQSIGTGTFS